MLVGIAANIVPAAMHIIEIVGDMGEFHAAHVDAACRADHRVAALHRVRVEIPADVMKVVRPLIIRRRRPYALDKAAVLQQVQLCLPTVSVSLKTATGRSDRQSYI